LFDEKKLKCVRIGTRPELYSNMFKRGPQINEELNVIVRGLHTYLLFYQTPSPLEVFMSNMTSSDQSHQSPSTLKF